MSQSLPPLEIEEINRPDLHGYRWSHDSVYMPDEGGFYKHQTPHVPRESMYANNVYWVLRPEFWEAIKDETGWRLLGSAPELPADMDQQVGEHPETCPHCAGGRWLMMPHIGERTEIIINTHTSCSCVASVKFWGFWTLENIPKRFLGCTLEGLTPCGELPLSTEKQEKIIRYVKRHPDDSFWLAGPSGTGKSYAGYSLLNHAARRWAKQSAAMETYTDQAVWCAYTQDHLDAAMAYKMRDRNDENDPTPAPKITARKIRSVSAQGHKPVIFLDEIDKPHYTDAKMADLGGIVGACWDVKGQLLATANKDGSGLADKWHDQDLVDTIIRRFSGGTDAHLIDFRDKVPV